MQLTYDISNQMHPDVAYANGVLHLVCQSDRSKTWLINYSQSQDEGVTCTQAVCLTDNPVGAWQPRVVAYSNNVLVGWVDCRSVNENVNYPKSSDGGSIWTGNLQLLPENGFSEHLDLTTDGEKSTCSGMTTTGRHGK